MAKQNGNRCRSKRSFLEKSFYNWLIQNDIFKFKTEHVIPNNLGTWWSCDFFFEDLNLIIELDGTQHEKTIDADYARDEYLRSIGYTTIRITHAQYLSRVRVEEVVNALKTITNVGRESFVFDEKYRM